MTEINEAYSVLSDAARRKAYDARRALPSVAPPRSRSQLWRRSVGILSQGLVVAGSLLVADVVATEEKPWWRWGWDAVASCGADTSHYTVSWPLWLLVVAAGIALAWKVGRGSLTGGRWRDTWIAGERHAGHAAFASRRAVPVAHFRGWLTIRQASV